MPLVTDKDSRGRTALHYCAEFCTTTDIAQALIKKKKNLVKEKDGFHNTPLHLAVIAGNKELCELFVANKCDLNAVDAEKHNVIHLATVYGHPALLKYLVKAGAKLNRPDSDGNFALHYAVQLCGGGDGGGKKGKDAKKGKKKKSEVAPEDVAAVSSGVAYEVTSLFTQKLQRISVILSYFVYFLAGVASSLEAGYRSQL